MTKFKLVSSPMNRKNLRQFASGFHLSLERNFMSIIQKLWWFFKLEKRRYLVGIVALVLVSVLNLIPPMVMGRVIDAITSGRLTQDELLLHLFYLLLAAFGMYYLRYVWRMYILGTSYRLGQIMRSKTIWTFYKDVSRFLSELSDWGLIGFTQPMISMLWLV